MWRRGWRRNCNERERKRERGRERGNTARWQAIHHHPSSKNCQYHSFVVVAFVPPFLRRGVSQKLGSGSSVFAKYIFLSRWVVILSQTVDAGVLCTGKPCVIEESDRQETDWETNSFSPKKMKKRSLY